MDVNASALTLAARTSRGQGPRQNMHASRKSVPRVKCLRNNTVGVIQKTGISQTRRSFRQATMGGFSLLEVVVALALTALMLASLLPATLSSIDRIAQLKQQSDALTLARTLLEKHLVLARSGEGAFEGRWNDYRWQVSIVRLSGRPDVGRSFAMREITVEVFSGESSPAIALHAYRMGEIR